MLQYLAKRLLLTIPTLLAVSLLVFLMLHLVPGDPAIIFFGDQPVTPERLEQVRRQMGLHRPLLVQYFDFLGGALRGDLGRSIHNSTPVLEEVRSRIGSSAQLALAAFVVAGGLGLGLGLVSALRRSTWVDAAAMLVALGGVSMPIFWLAAMLIFVFSIKLGWFPVTGFGGWNRLVLPAFALGFVSSATLARLVRSSVLEVLWQPYVTTARSKGLRETLVVRRHVLKNAFIAVVTVMGLQLGTLLSGAVITETVFARPGVGKLMVDAILAKDFPLVQGAVLFVALVYIVVNLVVDLSYAYLDPRIRFE
ncbi:MAG: ABC transporter permease [Armatimonadota bacterium]|nr:ABC transporter permease [Armatimonadota bacterium]MDR7422149.1 ABC transporter permease [Armatimonadota bacterium]MDR7495398.1 ABC transporter permease [Armatimonadota bacterium]MDR7511695.1 ABC transporter permease [Armatimonadota bacterium]